MGDENQDIELGVVQSKEELLPPAEKKPSRIEEHTSEDEVAAPMFFNQ